MAQESVAKNKSTRYFAWLVLAVIILVGAAGFYFYHQSHLPPYAHHYKKLSAYKLPGSKAGSGATFDKPKEFSLTTSAKDIKTRADLEYKKNINGKAVTLGSIHAQSNAVSSPDIISYLASAVKDSLKQSGPQQTSGFEYYAEKVLPSGDKITVTGAPQVLKTSNTNNNAWYVLFTMKPKDQAEHTHKGEVIIVLGKSTFYTFVIEDADSLWDVNQTVWKKVVDSIKIDQ